MKVWGLSTVAATAVFLLFGTSQAQSVQSEEELIQMIEQVQSRLAIDTVEEKVTKATTGTVVEFYNSRLDTYFITADPVEAAAIDGGSAGPGWSRTGDQFSSGGTTAVCRFYGSLSPGPNSHFYTASATECAGLKALQASTPVTTRRWNFESDDFLTSVPINGACAAPLLPVYRAYNNGFARQVDSNHRITSNLASIQQVVARGWINEGVVMCAPSSSPPLTTDQKTQQLIGGTWTIGPYLFGTRYYTDTLTYTSLFTSSTTGTIYAQGQSGYKVLTIGNFAPTLGQWAMLAPYQSTSSTPADFYVVTLNGNSLTGCYYFLATASSTGGACTPITGKR